MGKCKQNNNCCLPNCLFNFSSTQTVQNETTTKIELSTTPKSLNSFTNLVTNMISPFRNNKNIIESQNICKICNKEFINENKICDCLKKNIHPSTKETEKKIKENYILKQELVHQVIHIDKNPEKLVYLINDIYEIVERSSLHEDLTPKTMAKMKENLVNEICVNLEDYIKDNEE